MRTYAIIHKIILSFFLYLSLAACQKERITEKDENDALSFNRVIQYTPQQVTDAPYEEQRLYAMHHLGILSQSLLSVANDERFRDILYAEIEKEATGESAVLFSTLFKKVNTEEPSLVNEMQKQISLEDFTNAQKAFWGIEEKILFPQIYIPFFGGDESESEEKNLRTSHHPVIVTDPISDQELVTGYTVDNYDQIIEVNDIDEQYARENEVWVVSLNETMEVPVANLVPGQDEYPFLGYPDYQHKATDSGQNSRTEGTYGTNETCTSDGNPSNPRETEKGIDIFVNRLTIKDHKEPWRSGKSEVFMAVTSVWGDGYDAFTNKVDRTPFWEHSLREVYDINQATLELKDVDRASVRNKRPQYLGKRIMSNWGAPGDKRRDSVPFVVFEYDGWPNQETKSATAFTAGRFVIRVPNSNQYTFTIRTRDTPYCTGYFNWYQGEDEYACGRQISSRDATIDFYTRKGF